MRRLMLGVCLVGMVTAVAAQPPSSSAPESQAFEVATIKVNKSGERGQGIRLQPAASSNPWDTADSSQWGEKGSSSSHGPTIQRLM